MLNILITAALVAAPQANKPATNAKCPVLGEAVDKKTPTAVVNGQEYYLCCPGCKAKLEKNPGPYLNANGTPRNAK